MSPGDRDFDFLGLVRPMGSGFSLYRLREFLASLLKINDTSRLNYAKFAGLLAPRWEGSIKSYCTRLLGLVDRR